MNKNKNIECIKRATLSHKEEFLNFLKSNNFTQLTIGIILGAAGKDLVTSLSTNIIMPLVGLLTPSGSWKEIVFTVGKTQFNVGVFLSSILDFLIIALVVFIVIKKILKLETEVKEENCPEK